MVFFDPRLDQDLRKCRQGILFQDLVDLSGRDLLCACVCRQVHTRSLALAISDHSDSLHKLTAGMSPNRTLLDLRPVHAVKREERPAHVVEHLNGVGVDRVDLVSELDQRDHRIGIDLRRPVLQRIDIERIGQLGDDQKLPVGGHEVTIDPDDIEDDSKIGIGHLGECRSCRVPIVEPATRGNSKKFKRIGKRDQAAAADVPEDSHHPSRGNSHQLRPHDPVTDPVPLDPTAVHAWASADLHHAFCGSEVSIGDPIPECHRHHIHGIGLPEVWRVIREHSRENRDLHYFFVAS